MSVLVQLDPFLPRQVLPFIENWLKGHRFQLVLKRPRQTKLGDFTPPRGTRAAVITVNTNLAPFQFLLTLTHEIAHLVTWTRYGRKVRPHGREWKACFGGFLMELATVECLPEDYRRALGNHARSPKSAAHFDPELYGVLRRLDGQDGPILDEVPIGATFRFRNRLFKKLTSDRSRCVCMDLENGEKYRIAKAAVVELSGPNSDLVP